MRASRSLLTRIGVASLLALVGVTAAGTAFVLGQNAATDAAPSAALDLGRADREYAISQLASIDARLQRDLVEILADPHATVVVGHVSAASAADGGVRVTVLTDAGDSLDAVLEVPSSVDVERFATGIRAVIGVVLVIDGDDCQLGLVAPDGGIRFPSYGERSASFVEGVDTVDELAAAASADG